MAVYLDDLKAEKTFPGQRHGRFKGRVLRGVWSNATFDNDEELVRAEKLLTRGGFVRVTQGQSPYAKRPRLMVTERARHTLIRSAMDVYLIRWTGKGWP